MPPAVLDRSAINSLFSRASHWPSDGDWERVAREVAAHLIEHTKTGLVTVLVPSFPTSHGAHGGRSPFEVEPLPFYVGVHPVTNAQYARFVAETSHRPPDNEIWQQEEKMHHPVVCVDWDDATAYCRWAGLRLPTELEWEKAATALDGRVYPWGTVWDPNRCRNSKSRGSGTTAGVWRFGSGGSPFGGLQFCGNVWEWCVSHAVRGGTWCSDGSKFFSSSLCSFQHPTFRDDRHGFRCVLGIGASP